MRSRARCLNHVIDLSIPSAAFIPPALLNMTPCVPSTVGSLHQRSACTTTAPAAAACSLTPASVSSSRCFAFHSKFPTMTLGVGCPAFERSYSAMASLSHRHEGLMSKQQPLRKLSSGNCGPRPRMLCSIWEGNNCRLSLFPVCIRSYHRSTATAAAAARGQVAKLASHESPKALLSETLQTLVDDTKVDTDVTSITSLGPFHAVVHLPPSLQAIFPAGTVSTLAHT